MRKKYVFFTNSLGGFSGGPSYVRNKTKWLKQQGLDVVAFDSTSQIFEPIQFEILKEFEHNRFPELYFHPSWYSIRKREKIINFLILKIGDFDQCIIESNLLILSQSLPMPYPFSKAKTTHLLPFFLIFLRSSGTYPISASSECSAMYFLKSAISFMA